MIVGYVFISPFIFGFLIWFFIPCCVALWLTFHDLELDIAAELRRVCEY